MTELSLSQTLVRLANLLAEWPGDAAIIGGIAIVARVRPRFTEDIDVAITVPDGAAPKLLELLRKHGFDFDDEETRSFLEGGLVRAWAPPNRALGIGLDLLFANDPFFHNLIARATRIDLGAASLPVASLEDLILMKLDANRPADWDDIISIKDAVDGGAPIDLDYVHGEAKKLGVLDRLELYFGATDSVEPSP